MPSNSPHTFAELIYRSYAMAMARGGINQNLRRPIRDFFVSKDS